MFTIALIILFILLFALLAVLTFARDLLATFLGAVVGLFRKGDKDPQKKTDGSQTIRRRDRKKAKVYSESDGEYVDFEEVKK
ncbi:MAG: hypothetical protein IKX55_07050 [Bacteroidaceae bacterium]|nr:hypothetical protein [Bacteroidaceae bacterium]